MCKEKCDINCKFMNIRSGKDYDVFVSWKNAYCMAGKRFIYESNGDMLKTGDFPVSDQKLSEILKQTDCVAPNEKEIK